MSKYYQNFKQSLNDVFRLLQLEMVISLGPEGPEPRRPRKDCFSIAIKDEQETAFPLALKARQLSQSNLGGRVRIKLNMF